MIKKILCKLGLHKYKMRQFSLTEKVGTIVECKWCGVNLQSEMHKEQEQEKEKWEKRILET